MLVLSSIYWYFVKLLNAGKTKCMVISRDRNAARSHSLKINNSSFERVEQLQYLGTTLTNHNSVQEEIKSRLKSGNAYYHSVPYLLSSSLLSKNLKIKIYIYIYTHTHTHTHTHKHTEL